MPRVHQLPQFICQGAVSLHADRDAASVPNSWRSFVPTQWDHDVERRAKAGMPGRAGHREKWYWS
ncbi:transposase [Streptomyces sp. VTCC 41912]|uniref:transposase n=1 Tax=Streptomyces sp. VTCC 41912 TaxID=3383243 RepID=UPI0038969B70